MAVSEEDRQTMYRNMMHAVQVGEGLIPPIRPPTFVLPMAGTGEVKMTPAERKQLHDQQVAAGLLPADVPEDFVIPEGGVNKDGLPWWFPPDFKPYEVTIDGRSAGSLRSSRDDSIKFTPMAPPSSLLWITSTTRSHRRSRGSQSGGVLVSSHRTEEATSDSTAQADPV